MLSADVILTTATLYCPLAESLPGVVCQSCIRQQLLCLLVMSATRPHQSGAGTSPYSPASRLKSDTSLSVKCVSRPSVYCCALTCMLLSCVQARIKGSLKVFFYDTEAGVTQVEQVFARPRALAKSPYMLEVRHCMRSIGLSKSHFNAWFCAIRVKL